ncbi:extracellular solute-binding protein [Lachnospiraceae bacterium ZAX-1]
MKKMFSLLLIVAMCITMLSACGSSDSGDTGTTDPEPAATDDAPAADDVAEVDNPTSDGEAFTEEVTLDVAMMWSLDSTTDAKSYAMNNAIARLKEDYPNITVNYDGSVHDDYQTIMMTYAAADTLPDVFNIKGSWIKNFVDNGQIGSLNELFDEDKEWFDGFDEGALFDMNYEGQYYGAPFQNLGCSLIIWNKEIYKSVGYDSFPETWDEMIECFTKLKEAGYVPLGVGNKGQWVANSCIFGALGDRGAGTTWYDDIMNVTGDGFNDANMLKGVAAMAELAEKGFLNDNVNSIDQFEVMPPYLNEQYASYVDGSWTFGTLIATAGDDQSILEQSGVALFPALVDGIGTYPAEPGGSGWGQGYNANLEGAKKEAAYLFMKYTSDDKWCEDLASKGDFGGRTKAYDYTSVSPLVQQYVESLPTWTLTPMYDVHFDTTTIDAMNVNFQEVLAGTLSAEEWGKRVQEEYELAQ